MERSLSIKALLVTQCDEMFSSLCGREVSRHEAIDQTSCARRANAPKPDLPPSREDELDLMLAVPSHNKAMVSGWWLLPAICLGFLGWAWIIAIIF